MSQTRAESKKPIHVFWHGSALRQAHVKRINEWKKLNPDYRVLIWADEYRNEIRQQFNDESIKVVNSKRIYNKIKSIHPEITKFIDSLIAPRRDGLAPNYSAVSDIYRIYILHAITGWYFDLDIEPFKLSQKKINPDFNFHIFAQRDQNNINVLSPAAIYSSQNSLLTQKAIHFLYLFCRELSREKYIKMIRSSNASERMLATHFSTGFLLRGALGKIKINGKPIIEVDNENDNTIPTTKLFDELSSEFPSVFEQSWILAEPDESGEIRGIPGVVIDENYIKLQNGEITAAHFGDFFEDLFRLRSICYSKLREVEFQLPHDEYFAKYSSSDLLAPDSNRESKKPAEPKLPEKKINEPVQNLVTMQQEIGDSQIKSKKKGKFSFFGLFSNSKKSSTAKPAVKSEPKVRKPIPPIKARIR